MQNRVVDPPMEWPPIRLVGPPIEWPNGETCVVDPPIDGLRIRFGWSTARPLTHVVGYNAMRD